MQFPKFPLLVALGLVAASASLLAMGRAEPLADAEHVCNKTENVIERGSVEEPIEYPLTYQGMCGILPCTKKRTEVRWETRLRYYSRKVQVPHCCAGYAETPDRKCAPICLQQCQNGKCVEPNLCRCSPQPTATSPGYVGSTCSRFVCLAIDKWGAHCEHNCPPCSANAYCSASTGKCLCRAGWRGADCQEECTPSMLCEEVDLPPILEPEANIMPASSANELGQAQRLESRSLERSLDEASPNGRSEVSEFFTAHLGLNVALILVTLALLFTLTLYSRRLRELKNDLYYAVYASSSPGSSSNNSTYSSSTATGQNSIYSRPSNNHLSSRHLPTPPPTDALGKNLSFDVSTRNLIGDSKILSGVNSLLTSPSDEKSPQRHQVIAVPNKERRGFIVDPKTESHLASSQLKASQNIYSDLEAAVNHQQSICISEADETPDDGHYQVPRTRPVSELIGSNSLRYDESDLYEEIKPKQQPPTDGQGKQ